MSPGVRAIRGPNRERVIHIRVSDAQHAQFKRNGGGEWIRNLMRVSSIYERGLTKYEDQKTKKTPLPYANSVPCRSKVTVLSNA